MRLKSTQLLFLLLSSFIILSCENKIDLFFDKINALEKSRQFDIAIIEINRFLANNTLEISEEYKIKEKAIDLYLKTDQHDEIKNAANDLFEFSLESNDQNLQWEASKILIGIYDNYEYLIDTEIMSKNSEKLYYLLKNKSDFSDEHINISLSFSQLFERSNDLIHAAKVLLIAHELMQKESIEDKKTQIYIIEELSRLYALNNQLIDAVEIERILIKELEALDNSVFEDVNTRILLSIYKIVSYQGYETAEEYLLKYDSILSNENDYNKAIYYYIYGDIYNFNNDKRTHEYYSKAIQFLNSLNDEFDLIFQILIKDSLYSYRHKEYDLIYINYDKFTELYETIYKNEINKYKIEMDNIINAISSIK